MSINLIPLIIAVATSVFILTLLFVMQGKLFASLDVRTYAKHNIYKIRDGHRYRSKDTGRYVTYALLDRLRAEGRHVHLAWMSGVILAIPLLVSFYFI